jgi:hypothetical protein
MKMRRQELAQILFSPQFAHDLGDRQCGKNALGLQTQRQEISQHFNEQRRIQTITLSLHGTNLEDRFHHFPETLYHMMLLPNVPDFYTPKRHLTKIHQIEATSCTFTKKEQN